jgi:hypothetical protein
MYSTSCYKERLNFENTLYNLSSSRSVVGGQQSIWTGVLGLSLLHIII